VRRIFILADSFILMSLRAVVGNHRRLNHELLLYAFENVPCLVVDCANVANPHPFASRFPLELFHKVFVVEVELIYTLRDVLKRVPRHINELGLKCVVITSFNHLFNYQDEHENREIYLHAWELMKEISQSVDVFVGVKEGGKQVQNAVMFADEVVELSKKELLSF